jgi:hypothetical protein
MLSQGQCLSVSAQRVRGSFQVYRVPRSILDLHLNVIARTSSVELAPG